MLSLGHVLLVIIFVNILIILPASMALFSKKVSGGRKLIWFLLSFLASFIGYLLYYFLVVRPLLYKKHMHQADLALQLKYSDDKSYSTLIALNLAEAQIET